MSEKLLTRPADAHGFYSARYEGDRNWVVGQDEAVVIAAARDRLAQSLRSDGNLERINGNYYGKRK